MLINQWDAGTFVLNLNLSTLWLCSLIDSPNHSPLTLTDPASRWHCPPYSQRAAVLLYYVQLVKGQRDVRNPRVVCLSCTDCNDICISLFRQTWRIQIMLMLVLNGCFYTTFKKDFIVHFSSCVSSGSIFFSFYVESTGGLNCAKIQL